MKRRVTITSGVFDEPYSTDCIYDETESRLFIKWMQQGNAEERKSFYEITLDKESGVAVITRRGDVESRLVFDTGRRTTGVIKTPYGNIEIDIKTEYITVPSVMAPRFEICYDMAQSDGSLIKNTFSLNFPLQNL